MRTTLVAVLFGCMAVAQAAEWPPSVQHLAAFVGDESQFVIALRDYDKSLIIKIENARVQARLLNGQGKVEEASALLAETQSWANDLRKAYEIGLEYYSSNALLHNFYGDLLYDIFKSVPAALRAWNLALSYDGKLSAPYNNLALHDMHNGAYEQGLRNLDQALALDNDNPDYIYNMVQTYLVHGPQVGKIRNWKEKKIYREAMRLSKRAAKVSPDDFELQKDYAFNFFLAENFGVEAKWKQAAVAWQRTRELTVKDEALFYTWINEGIVWTNDESFDNAITCLKEALRINSNSDRAKNLIEDAEQKRFSSQ